MGDIYDLCGPGHECPHCKGRYDPPKKAKSKFDEKWDVIEKRFDALERKIKELKKKR